MITPSDSASSPEHYAEVAVQPMDIQADVPVAEVTAACDAAVAVWGGLSGTGPREQQARTLLESPQGFGLSGWDVTAGTTHGWPANVEPPGM